MNYVYLTNDGEKLTCKMPPDETIVEVMLENGTKHRAFYSCNILESGDWEFVPADENDDPTDEAFWPEVAAWRNVP